MTKMLEDSMNITWCVKGNCKVPLLEIRSCIQCRRHIQEGHSNSEGSFGASTSKAAAARHVTPSSSSKIPWRHDTCLTWAPYLIHFASVFFYLRHLRAMNDPPTPRALSSSQFHSLILVVALGGPKPKVPFNDIVEGCTFYGITFKVLRVSAFNNVHAPTLDANGKWKFCAERMVYGVNKYIRTRYCSCSVIADGREPLDKEVHRCCKRGWTQ